MVFKTLLALFALNAWASDINVGPQQFIPGLSKGGVPNYVSNPYCRYGVADITQATTTVTRITNSFSDIGTACRVAALFEGDVAKFTAREFPARLDGKTCETTFTAETTGDWKAYVEGDGATLSDEVILLSGNRDYSLIFPCGSVPYSSSAEIPKVVFEALDDSTDDVDVIVTHLGEAVSVGSVAQAYDFGSLTYAAQANCEWTNSTFSTTTPGSFGTDSDCTTRSATGNVKLPSTLLAAFVIPAESPSGTYYVDATGAFQCNRSSGAVARCLWSFFDGTTHHNIQQVRTTTSDSTTVIHTVPNFKGSIPYVTSSTDTTIEIRASTMLSGGSTTIISDTSVTGGAPLTFNVTYFPTSSQIVQRADVKDLVGFAQSPATSGCEWLTTSATMASFAADSDCPALTTSGNAASPATKIPAFVAPNLLPGKYKVEASGFILSLNSSSDLAACQFEIWDGSTSGGRSSVSQDVGQGRDGTTVLSGYFEYTSKQTNTQFEIRARRASGNGSCAISAALSVDLTFALIPLTQAVPSPFVAGSVFAGRSGVVKDSMFWLACSSSSTIVNDEDGAIASIGNISSGACAVNFNTNFYNNAPLCVGTRLTNTTDRHATLTGLTSSGFSMRGTDGSSASTSFDMAIFCRATR